MTKKPRWRTAVPRLSQFAAEHLLLLPVGALIAMAWVNWAPESYYSFTYGISFAVNDVAMVFFFAVMTKEVVEATIPGGVLHPWRRALLPVIAALGATVVPALIHSRIVDTFFDEPMLALGWPVAFATDLAFAYFIARIIFRPQHPAIPFVLLLAIASDALGFAVLAIYNPGREVDLVTGGLLMVAAMAVAWGLRRGRVTSFWPYLIGAGGLSWYAGYRAGLNPALALVPIMPFLPHAARDPGFFVDASPDAPDTLSRFEIWWRHPAQIALFFFGLVNAGIPLRALEQGTWGLPIAVIAGKPIGIIIATGIALAVGLHLPERIGWRELVVIGFSAALGFSVGLFFCAVLLPPGQLRSEMSMGVLLSLMAAPAALIAARLLHVGRYAR